MKRTKKQKSNVLCVITARSGSKGLPGKNIKKLGGAPLICYSVKQASRSNLITHAIISTDDKKIAAVARKCGGNVPFLRPKKLAQDTTPHLPVIQHAIQEAEKLFEATFDYVVIFQPTSPFRTIDDIDGTLRKLVETNADSAVSICEVDTHPSKIKVFDGDFVSDFVPESKKGARRQDLKTYYRRSSAVYATKRDIIMKKDSLYGKKIAGHVVPKNRSVDIDTIEDFERAELMLKRLKKDKIKIY